MACTYTGSVESDRAYAHEEQNKSLREKIDLVTRLLCTVTTNFEQIDSANYTKLVQSNPELKAWVEIHSREDANRWFNHYKHTYPTFTKQEIAKMVKNNILPNP